MIEVAVASIIVSMAVLSIVAAQQAYIRVGDVAQKTDVGLSLANEVREITMNMPAVDPIYGEAIFGPEPGETSVIHYNDLDDFSGFAGNGITFSPPINALRQVIPNMDGWAQLVTVESVAAGSIAGSAVTPGTGDMLRLTVRVTKDNVEHARLIWFRTGK